MDSSRLNYFSIIIPTYNLQLERLRRCIDSIVQYTDLDNIEIIVVSNGQSAEVNEYLKSQLFLRVLLFPEPLGFAKAINEGIKASTGEFIILLNDDVELLQQHKNEWIERLYQPFLEDEKVGITGTTTNSCEPLSLEFLLFYCVMIKREVIRRVGLLDEGYKIGAGEDADYCMRCIRHGFLIRCVATTTRIENNMAYGDFPIFHLPDSTVKTISGFEKQFTTNFRRLVAKFSFDDERPQWGIADNIPPEDELRWKWLAGLLEEFEIKNGKRATVLEIGCGTGYGYKYIKEYVSKYIGIDKDPAVIEFANIDFGGENAIFEVKNYETLIQQQWKPRNKVDFVICFEVLEHLTNFQQGLEHLFELGYNVVVTVPYNEPEGFWGPYHTHWHIDESWFPGKPLFWYQTFDNRIIAQKDNVEIRNLYVYYPFKEEDGLTIKEDIPSILVYISTKNRYFTTLPLTILSIAFQSILPQKLIILDDGEHRDLRSDNVYQSLFLLLDEKEIQWEVVFTPQQGQVKNHQLINRQLGKAYDWCWRIDDDEVAEPNIVERFLRIIKTHKEEKIGAVGFSTRVPLTGRNVDKIKDLEKFYCIKIEDLVLPNIQMQFGKTLCYPEHLYSSFFYKPNIVDFNTQLSTIGHTEETQFTYDLYQKGYKLIVDLGGNVYHFQQLSGGIRSNPNPEWWEQDSCLFLEKYGLTNRKFFVICNPNGLGDNLVMARALRDLQTQLFSELTPLIGTGYPEAYFAVPCRVVDLNYIRYKTKINPDFDNIYRYAQIHKITGNLYDFYVRWLKEIVSLQKHKRTIRCI